MSDLDNYDKLNNKIIELERKIEKIEKDFIEQMKKLDKKLDQWVDKRVMEMKEIARKIEAKLDDMKIKLNE